MEFPRHPDSHADLIPRHSWSFDSHFWARSRPCAPVRHGLTAPSCPALARKILGHGWQRPSCRGRSRPPACPTPAGNRRSSHGQFMSVRERSRERRTSGEKKERGAPGPWAYPTLALAWWANSGPPAHGLCAYGGLRFSKKKTLGLHLCTSLLLICCIRGPRKLDSDGVTFCIALLINISCYIIYSLFIEQCLVNYVVDAHVQ